MNYVFIHGTATLVKQKKWKYQRKCAKNCVFWCMFYVLLLLLMEILQASVGMMGTFSLRMLGYKVDNFSNTYETASKEQSCRTANWYYTRFIRIQ